MIPDLERYAAGNGLLHRWDPRWKLGSYIALAAALASLQTLAVSVAAAVLSVMALGLCRLPISILASRLGAVHLFLLPCFIVLPFTVSGMPLIEGMPMSAEGAELAAILYCRALAIVALSIALIYTTPMNRLVQAAEAMRFPTLLVQITFLTYRYLYSLGAEFARVKHALAIRAFKNEASLRTYQTWANVVGLNLVRSLEKTERIHRSMRCRGYDGRLRSVYQFHASAADAWGAALCALVGVCLVAGDWLWRFD